MQLVRPGVEHLASYTAALQRGWSADTVRGAAAALEEMDRIAVDPGGFLATMDDPDALGPLVTLPDGTQRARIPSLRRWMWDEDGFAGTIGLRWMYGGLPLPPHVLGHIGYSVVAWKQRLGYATQALGAMLELARERGLQMVEITTDPGNLASQRVIEANGGVLVGRFDKGAPYGNQPGLRFKIVLVR
jgi:predicted acetyltransferase